MATAENARLYVEEGGDFFDFTEATNSGDNRIFTIPSKKIWSGDAGKEPVIRPNGIVGVRDILSAHGDNDKLSFISFPCNLAGVETAISAGTVTVTRPGTDVAKVCSITVNASGEVVEVEGAVGSGTTFSYERGAAGGPPWIPVDSVEMGQIRVTSSIAAPIKESEIKQVIGTHCEWASLPTWKTPVNGVGLGYTEDVAAKVHAHLEFSSALNQPIHTGGLNKKVFISGYVPIFAEISNSVDFVPAEETDSQSSEQVYGGSIGSISSSVDQASFTAKMNDGISDPLVPLIGKRRIFKFKPHYLKAPYMLTQGKLGAKTTFPAISSVNVAATITVETKSARFLS